MDIAVRCAANPACSEQHRPGRLGTLLCDLARISRLRCPSRQPAAAATTSLPLLILPVPLLACIFGHGGLPAMFNVSLSCHPVHEQLWQSPLLWRAVLHAIGAPVSMLRDAGFHEHGTNRWQSSAKALHAFARHWLFGIDRLVAMPSQVQVKIASDSKHRRCSVRPHMPNLDLEVARKAVRAMQSEDGGDLLQRASESIANLLRWRAPGKAELMKAEFLLEAVSARSDIFTIAQMLDMLGAHQEQALSVLPDCCPPWHGSSRTSRRPISGWPSVANGQVTDFPASRNN